MTECAQEASAKNASASIGAAHRPPKRHYDLELEDLSRRYVEDVARLHAGCFPDKIESVLGARCIADLLHARYLSEQRDSFCRIAVLRADRSLAGYVCGTPLRCREDWSYVFIDRATLRRHLLRRFWNSPRLWRFTARRLTRKLFAAGLDEGDVLESTPWTEVVNMIAVRPECRGGNVGADLMRDYEAQARRRGARRLHLLVEAGNLRAERLYESLGWRRTCSDRARYAVFAMAKDLEPAAQDDS